MQSLRVITLDKKGNTALVTAIYLSVTTVPAALGTIRIVFFVPQCSQIAPEKSTECHFDDHSSKLRSNFSLALHFECLMISFQTRDDAENVGFLSTRLECSLLDFARGQFFWAVL